MIKTKYFILSAIIICLALIFNCQNYTSGSGGNNSNPWSSSDDWGYLFFSNNEYKLINSVWGKGNITNYSQSIFYNDDNNFGWRWDWPNVPNSNFIKAYPGITYGQSPWSGPSTTSRLPELITNSNFIMNVSAIQNLSGRYDTMFDIWFTDSPVPNGYNSIPVHLKAELMIWLNYSNMPINGYDVTIDGEQYKLDYNPNMHDLSGNTHWIGMTYFKQNMTSSITLNLSSFLNDLVNRGYIQSNWYVSDIEFGNEVGYGTGETIIKHFEITK